MPRKKAERVLLAVLIVVSTIGTYQALVERTFLKNQAEQFAMATKAADAGQWFWDIEKNEVRWDETMFTLFGVSKDGWVFDRTAWVWRGGDKNGPAQIFYKALLDDEKENVMSLINRSIADRTGYKAVFHIVGDDGQIRLIRAGGKVYKNGKFMTGLCLEVIKPSDFGAVTSKFFSDPGERHRIATEQMSELSLAN